MAEMLKHISGSLALIALELEHLRRADRERRAFRDFLDLERAVGRDAALQPEADRLGGHFELGSGRLPPSKSLD